MPQLNCVVVTPEATALDTAADFIVLPLYDGELGVAPGRAPLIGRLGFGEMRVTVGGQVTRYYVDGGFVQVAHNMVSVLTNRALLAHDVDADAARNQLEQTRQLAITTAEQEAIRDRNLQQARAQIRCAQRI